MGKKFFHSILDKMATHTGVRKIARQAKSETRLSHGCSTHNFIYHSLPILIVFIPSIFDAAPVEPSVGSFVDDSPFHRAEVTFCYENKLLHRRLVSMSAL